MNNTEIEKTNNVELTVDQTKQVTPEMFEKVMECKTAEDFVALAKENNIVISVEQAEKFLKKLHSKAGEIDQTTGANTNSNAELSDEQLADVAGGSRVGPYRPAPYKPSFAEMKRYREEALKMSKEEVEYNKKLDSLVLAKDCLDYIYRGL